MSQLMQLQIENERTFLTYKYKKVQDIDDVILQLLNEADIEGFAESHMNKAKSTVNYDVTGYRKWSELSSDELTPEVMASAMENLYHLLAYLEDSFIDIEYVLLDKEYIYVNPGNGKLVILVVPCQAVVDEEYTLTDCVRQMFEQFTYGEGACAKQLKSCLQQEIHALETLKELADLLRAYDAEPEEPGETVSDEPAVPEETVILEAIEEEADQIKTESANIAADAEYMRSQLWEDMRHELEKELREQRSDIAMIFQHFNLLMQKSVLDNVCFPMQIAKKKKDEAKKRALELLETVGLADKADAYPAQLSGGQKQRVAIARALATDPKILLCDEATSALDPQTTQSILALLKEINRKFGITIVIITHQMSVIREICSHVAIVEKGSIVEVGLVEEIFNHPKSRVARSLILSDRAADAASYSGAEGDTADGAELTGWSGESRQRDSIGDDKKLRIVFSENSAFEPVIANMVLKFGTPVNILRADTKNVGGVAKGEMILGLPSDAGLQEQMEAYLVEKGLEIEEVTGDVE